ncbi:MAG: TVP38/TMEM64 family protein [bacterium]|nr:TVP38/TMEM64 family protein [bacterium]
MDAPQSNSADPPQMVSRPPAWKKLALLVILLLSGGILYGNFSEQLSLDYLASKELQLRELRSHYPWWTAWSAVLIYIVVAGLSIPGALVLTLFCGWYFGFWQGLLIVSFGSTGGAMVAFLLSRYFLRTWVQEKFAGRASIVQQAFERDGAFYLFTLRLIPVLPFFVINLIMGVTNIRASTFWWVSQLGMLPATMAYVYAGSSVPSLQALASNGPGQILTPQLLLAFGLIGLLPLVLRRCLAWLKSKVKEKHA